MDIRMLTKNDTEKAMDLYVRCMSETEHFKSMYHLRRANDQPELIARLLMDHGPALDRVIAYGTSLGAWDGDDFVGLYINFWYKVIHEHDRSLFHALFNDKNGVAGNGSDLCRWFAGLSGTILYSPGLCVAPERRRERIATRLVESSRMRLRPDWAVSAICNIGAMPVYQRFDCDEYKLDDGRILCVAKMS